MAMPPAAWIILGSLYVLWRIDHSSMPEPRKALLGILTVLSWPLVCLVL